MTISVWRYSHLALAVSSCLFLLLASITGMILAVEPVNDRFPNHRSDRFYELTVADVLPAVKKGMDEVNTLQVDVRQFVRVKGLDEQGDQRSVYIDPATGTVLGNVKEQNPFFQWVTALHRSLFLHELGRFFIGLAAFLLLLITVSGTLLLIQRQRGIKRFFTRIVKDSSAQYYHVVLGRLLLIPVFLIAISGTYLSLVRFGFIPQTKAMHTIDFDAIRLDVPNAPPDTLAIFRDIPLLDVRQIEFPFSTDPEDYYLLKLKDRELAIDQYSGEVLSEVRYPFVQLATELSLDLHTGRTNMLWALILGIACINILYFMYSGCVITLKRLSGKTRNPHKPEESRFVILVGSENGSTRSFAKLVHNQLLKQGERSYLCELNQYRLFPKAEQMIVLTSTYGLGDAPVNAARFPELLTRYPQQHPIQFTVVGFGSQAYPDFCRFAFDVHDLLLQQPWASPLMAIHTVNDRSPEQFGQWFEQWGQRTGLKGLTLPSSLQKPPFGLQSFRVTARTERLHPEGAFLLRMRPIRWTGFTSGDLLNIYPANDHRLRQYSIGKVKGEIQLSVRLHEGGLGSGFLHQLQVGDKFKGLVQRNPGFHLPKMATSVIMIANGTGIAPFLGMIDENKAQMDIHLYAGFRGQASFALYEQALQTYQHDGKLRSLQIAFSREGAKQYVNELIAHDVSHIAATLGEGGVIMLCGSLAMEKDILEVLEKICTTHGLQPLSHYRSAGQIRSDCY